MHSAALSYLEIGHQPTATLDQYKYMIERKKQNLPVRDQLGAFTIPICHVEKANFGQSGAMGEDTGSESSHAPCDCTKSVDRNGRAFKDAVSQDVQDWLANAAMS